MAEKLITLGKRNNPTARKNAQGILFEPEKHIEKLFGELRERYATRPGGYTRVLRMEPKKNDQADSAILELVDGPRDMRFSMTARALVRQREEDLPMHELTAQNMRKVTRFREDGESMLEQEVKRLEKEKRDVASREQEEFDRDGTQLEWVRSQNAPGRVRKRKVWSGAPGEDRFEDRKPMRD